MFGAHAAVLNASIWVVCSPALMGNEGQLDIRAWSMFFMEYFFCLVDSLMLSCLTQNQGIPHMGNMFILAGPCGSCLPPVQFMPAGPSTWCWDSNLVFSLASQGKPNWVGKSQTLFFREKVQISSNATIGKGLQIFTYRFWAGGVQWIWREVLCPWAMQGRKEESHRVREHTCGSWQCTWGNGMWTTLRSQGKVCMVCLREMAGKRGVQSASGYLRPPPWAIWVWL